jgi:TPR repeat protein
MILLQNKTTSMKSISNSFLILCSSLLFFMFFNPYVIGQNTDNKNFKAGLAAYESNNLKLAYEKFLKGSNEGHVYSQFNLALMYENGIGIKKNEKYALFWYNKAAMQGNAAAQFNLGVLYENGKGTKVDFAQANKWYRKAAVQNDGLAVGNLGMLYIRGDGVKMNKTAGVALLLLSIQIDQSPENTAKQMISSTTGLTQNMIADAQALADKMFNSGKNMLMPLDQFLKK